MSGVYTTSFPAVNAPRIGQPNEDEGAFWQLLNTKTSNVPYPLAVTLMVICVKDNQCIGVKNFATNTKFGKTIADFAKTQKPRWLSHLPHLPCSHRH